MSASHRLVDHTSEVGLEVEAETLELVFAHAALGLAELLGERDGRPVTREVRVEAADRPALLVEWLEELVFLSETERLVPARVGGVALDETTLAATVEGRESAPRHLVKAVTYHDLVLEQRGGGWFARVVLDV